MEKEHQELGAPEEAREEERHSPFSDTDSVTEPSEEPIEPEDAGTVQGWEERRAKSFTANRVAWWVFVSYLVITALMIFHAVVITESYHEGKQIFREFLIPLVTLAAGWLFGKRH